MPQRIRRGHHRALNHVGMFDQRALNFKRADAIVGGFEDIVGAANKRQITFRIALYDVSGTVDRAFQRNQIAIVTLVAGHQRRRRRVQRQAQLAFFGSLILGIEQPHVVPGKRTAHGADFQLLSRRIADLRCGLGLAVAIADGEPPRGADLLDHFRVQRFACAGQLAQPDLPISTGSVISMRQTVGGAQNVVTPQPVMASSSPRALKRDWLITKTVASAFQGAKKQLQACLAQPGEERLQCMSPG